MSLGPESLEAVFLLGRFLLEAGNMNLCMWIILGVLNINRLCSMSLFGNFAINSLFLVKNFPNVNRVRRNSFYFNSNNGSVGLVPTIPSMHLHPHSHCNLPTKKRQKVHRIPTPLLVSVIKPKWRRRRKSFMDSHQSLTRPNKCILNLCLFRRKREY